MNLLSVGPGEAELEWDKEIIIRMHRMVDKLWRHTGMLAETLAEASFPILVSLAALLVTATIIPPGDNEGFTGL